MSKQKSSLRRSIVAFMRGLGAVSFLAGALLGGPAIVQAKELSPPSSAATVADAGWVTQPIEVGTLNPFTHQSNWFQAKVPANWKVKDESTAYTASIILTDPTGNGAVNLIVFGGVGELSKAQMAAKLDAFARKAFGEFDKFTASPAKPLKSLNGAAAAMAYRQKLGNKSVSMYGDLFYEQHGEGDSALTSVMVMLLPQEQYTAIKDKVYPILDSFKALPENYAPGGAQNEEPPLPPSDGGVADPGAFSIGELTDFTAASGKFSLRVPADWSHRASKIGTTPYDIWADSTGAVTVTVVSTRAPGALTAAMLRTTAREFIKGYAGGNESMRNLNVESVVDVDKTAAQATFTYSSRIDGQWVDLTAFVLVRQRSQALGFVLVTVPSADLGSNVNTMDEIVSSLALK